MSHVSVVVPGNWSPWKPWEECSVTCGNGVKRRTRACDNPEPQHGGALCEGVGEEEQPCNEGPCGEITHSLIHARTFVLSHTLIHTLTH